MNDSRDIFEALQSHFGSLSALSRVLGFPHQSTVSNWRQRGRVPAEHCIKIEQAAAGAITRYDLRPDVFGEAVEPLVAAHELIAAA